MSKKHKHKDHKPHGHNGNQKDLMQDFYDPLDDDLPILNASQRDFTKPNPQFQSCYHSHPPLPIKMTEADLVRVGGELYKGSTFPEGQDYATLTIHGGNCHTPVVKDADIYIGFDHGAEHSMPKYPWNPAGTGPTRLLFEIPDMGVPANVNEFKRMIEWVAVQLIAGKKVHMGCIGGHGRTGLVFSALVKHMTGMEDAITYVRKNYCEKAVESARQVDWLNQHFGIAKVKGAKEFTTTHSSSTHSGITSTRSAGKPTGDWWKDHERFGAQSIPKTNAGSSGEKQGYIRDKYAAKPKEVLNAQGLPSGEVESFPTKSPMCVWGPEVLFSKFDKQSKPATIVSVPELPAPTI